MVETLWIPVSHLIEITGDYGQQRAGPGRSCFNYSLNNSGYSSRSWTPARARQSAFTPTGGRTIITAEGPERPSTGQGLQRTAAVTDTDIYSNDLSEGAKMKDKNRHKKYHCKDQTSKNKKEKKD